ncbi:MAG: hypothetical protein Q7S28_01220 [bacterium]|nr:hypothetical protein [bacterium]
MEVSMGMVGPSVLGEDVGARCRNCKWQWTGQKYLFGKGGYDILKPGLSKKHSEDPRGCYNEDIYILEPPSRRGPTVILENGSNEAGHQLVEFAPAYQDYVCALNGLHNAGYDGLSLKLADVSPHPDYEHCPYGEFRWQGREIFTVYANYCNSEYEGDITVITRSPGTFLENYDRHSVSQDKRAVFIYDQFLKQIAKMRQETKIR